MACQNHSVALITITVHFLQEFISYDFCHIFKGDLRPAEIKISCFCSRIIMFSKVKGFSNMVILYNIFKLTNFLNTIYLQLQSWNFCFEDCCVFLAGSPSL